jgi:hypothetical protein
VSNENDILAAPLFARVRTAGKAVKAHRREQTIDERFAAFDGAHPEVFAEFKRLALEARRRGHEHYSADGILHVVRWHTSVNPQKDEGFKINNDFSSRYARKLIAEDGTFATFFELRALKSDRRVA